MSGSYRKRRLLQQGRHHVDLGVVSVDANRAEDLLDVGGNGFSSTEDGRHGSSNVTNVVGSKN